MSAAAVAPVANRGAITFAIMLATIMQVLDSTIANVALPDMQASLGAARDSITWVLTSYIVATAIATPLTGWLADRLGARRLFMLSVGGFIVASMLCGIAQNLPEMVAFRVAQGVCGAFLIPLAQTVLLNINPRERHGQAMALYGTGIMIGPILGPVLGGWLTDHLNWRWVFYVNLPIGLVALLGLWLYLPRAAIVRRRFDLFGFALLALAVGAAQMLLDRGQQVDWFDSAEVIAYAAVAAIAAWMFAAHVATGKEPLLPPAMLRDRNLVTALLFIFVVGILLLAGMALLPPMLQHLYGYPIVTTGLVLAPRGAGTMVSMLLVGRLVNRVDARLLIGSGLVLMAFSLWQMTRFGPGMDAGPVIVSGVIQGLGIGLIFVPLSTLAFATLPAALRTDAASFYSLMRNLGSAVGISLVTTLLARNAQINHAELAGRLTASRLPVDPAMAQGLGASGDQLLGAMDAMVNRQALMIAYLNDFQLMMWLSLAALPLVLLMRPAVSAAPPPMAHAD